MTENLLVTIAGVLMSLAFGYVGGLKEWYDARTGVQKAQVMAAALLVAAAGVFALSCRSPYVFTTCDEAGLWGLAELFAQALIANQTAYLIAVRPFKA